MDVRAFFLMYHQQLHGRTTDRVLGGLTEQQIRGRPHPAVNSIAWLIWHVARIEDLCLNCFIAERPQVLDADDWTGAMGVARRDVGIGMTFAAVDTLSDQVDLGGLRAYWAAVGRRTAEIVECLDPADLDQPVVPALVRQAIFEHGAIVSDDAGEIADAWCTRTKGNFLGYLGLNHTVGHFSDIDVVRGMYGLRFPH